MNQLQMVVIAVTLTMALAACGGDAGQTTADDPTEAPPDDPTTEEPAGATVAVASTELGEILVDQDGMTLYLFEPDEQGASTCYDACADNWPPFVTDGDPQAGEGADEALLGSTERTDGATQVTYDGWPLYHWAQDESPGDTNGQGINDVWWVVGPDGQALREATAGADSPAAPY